MVAWKFSPLIGTILIVAGLWLALQNFHTTDDQDRWLLLSVSMGYLTVCLIMLIGTRAWTIPALGLFCSLMGDAWLYYIIAGGFFGLVNTTEPYTDVARALFISGVVLTLASVIRWTYRAYIIWKYNRTPESNLDKHFADTNGTHPLS
jgi:uncharacterized membrane protein HdeD (DUF308 family)